MDAAELAQSQAATRRFQSELFVLEGDRGRLERKHEEILVEVRRLKDALVRSENEKREKEAVALGLEHKIAQVNDEIKMLKRKMNSI